MQNNDLISKKQKNIIHQKPQQDLSPPQLRTNIKGEIIDVNQSFCDLIKTTRNNIIGNLLEDLTYITPASRKTIMLRNIKQLIGKQLSHFSFNVQSTDGTEIQLQIKATPQQTNGKIVGEIMTVTFPRIISSPKNKPNSPINIPERKTFHPKQPQKSVQKNVTSQKDIPTTNLHQEIKQLKEELTKRNTIIQQLNSQITEAKTMRIRNNEPIKEQNNKKIKQIQTQQNTIQQQEKDLVLLNEQITNQQQQLQEKNQYIQNLTNQLNDHQNQLAIKKQVNDESQKILSHLQQQHNNLTTKIETLTIQLTEKIRQKDTIHHQLFLQETHLTDLNNLIATQTKELNSIKIQLQDKKQLLNILKQENENLNETLQTTQNDLAQRNSIIINLQNQLENHHIKLIQKTVETTQTTHQIEINQEELNLRNTIIQQLHQQLNDQQSQLQKTTHLSTELTSQIQEKENNLETTAHKLLTIQKSQQHSTNQLINLQNELDTRNIIIHNLQTQLSNQHTKNLHKISKITKLTKQLQNHQQLLEEKTHQLILHTTKISNLQTMFDQLQQNISSSVLIFDKNNQLITWNKQAESLLKNTTDDLRGQSLVNLRLLDENQIKHLTSTQKTTTKSTILPSIHLPNKKGETQLSTITHQPLHTNIGEFTGSILIIDNQIDNAIPKTDIDQTQKDHHNLIQQYQDIYKKLNLADIEITTTNHELKQRKTQLKETKDKLTHLELKIQNTEQELGTTTKKFQETQQKISDLKQQLSKKTQKDPVIHQKLMNGNQNTQNQFHPPTQSTQTSSLSETLNRLPNETDNDINSINENHSKQNILGNDSQLSLKDGDHKIKKTINLDISEKNDVLHSKLIKEDDS
jgi:epidermal growth factor receptor substrate 15